MRGFTLLEIILSVALISLIAAIGIPTFQFFQNKNDLDIATVTFVQSSRRAQVLSQAVDGDSNWGVHIQEGSITLFKGDSFSGRDDDFDEVFDISDTITVSGLQELVFDRLTGIPQSIGTLNLTSVNNDIREVTINEKGTLEY